MLSWNDVATGYLLWDNVSSGNQSEKAIRELAHYCQGLENKLTFCLYELQKAHDLIKKNTEDVERLRGLIIDELFIQLRDSCQTN